MPRLLFAESDERPTVGRAYSTAAKRLMGCSAELTREWCINVLDAPLEIFAKECPLSVCGPRWSCHARRGLAFYDARAPRLR
jgi:hypothetical protein